MTRNRMISSAVLLLLLGITLPVFAQKGEEEKGGGGKNQPAQQHRAQPQRQQQAQPQRQQPAPRQQQAQHQAQPARPLRQAQTQRQAQPPRAQAPQPARQQTQRVAYNRSNENYGNHYGRISDANYGSHFGHDHHFQMGPPQFVGGYNRFQYGGYSFGYNQAWPAGWGYNDSVYVVYEGGGYYLYDLMHPGIHISLNIF